MGASTGMIKDKKTLEIISNNDNDLLARSQVAFEAIVGASANRPVRNPWPPEIGANIALYPPDEIFRLGDGRCS
jgi:hypothetical protein